MICSFKKIVYPHSVADAENGSYMIAHYNLAEKVLDAGGKQITDVTVVGYYLPVTVGVMFDLEGRWTKHPQYGTQYELESYREVVTPTREGIMAYLSSGLLKGVGPEIAMHLYSHFGDEILNVLDTQTERLLEVPGIKKIRLQRICDSYLASRSARDTVALLAPHGVSAKRAVKIYKEFGNEAVGIIQRQPYRLSEMAGIGFLTADSIARSMGLDPLSSDRIAAGLLYTLQDAETQGNLCIPKDALIKQCIKLLQTEGLTEEYTAVEACKLLSKEEIVLYQDQTYRAITAEAEQDVAVRLLELIRRGTITYSMNLDSEIDRVQKSFSLTLASEQRKAVKSCLTSHICIVSGGPGTGKTLIQKVLLDIYGRAQPGAKILCCAPTGRAARRMSECTGYPASTLHKALEINPEDDIAYVTPKNLDADFVLVDEVSMLDIHLARHLLTALPRNCRLILVGDAEQLPSVGPGAVLSEMIACGRIPVVMLDKVFRQDAGSRIAANAKRIRDNNSSLDYGEDFKFVESANFENSANLLEQMYIEEVQRAGLDNVAMLTPYRKKTETGVAAMNERLHAKINPPDPAKAEVTVGRKLFREGDKVMQVKNNEDINNGDVGKITSITVMFGETSVVVDFGDERVAEYTVQDLDMLELAYASTVHKSQGSEYQTVLISLQTAHYIMLKRPLIYTAITRARQRVIIVGEKKALRMAIRKVDAEKRGTLLAMRITENCPNRAEKQITKGVNIMATMLENYLEQKNSLDVLMATQPLASNRVWQYQELLYRIEVLGVCQMFSKTAPQTMESKALVAHYQMVDAYIQSLSCERRYGESQDDDSQKRRNTAHNSLQSVIMDHRKRFASFAPDSDERYKSEILKAINTILPAWIGYRNTFVEITKIEEAA